MPQEFIVHEKKKKKRRRGLLETEETVSGIIKSQVTKAHPFKL